MGARWRGAIRSASNGRRGGREDWGKEEAMGEREVGGREVGEWEERGEERQEKRDEGGGWKGTIGREEEGSGREKGMEGVGGSSSHTSALLGSEGAPLERQYVAKPPKHPSTCIPVVICYRFIHHLIQ